MAKKQKQTKRMKPQTIYGTVTKGRLKGQQLEVKVAERPQDCKVRVNGKPLHLVQRIVITLDVNDLTRIEITKAIPFTSKSFPAPAEKIQADGLDGAKQETQEGSGMKFKGQIYWLRKAVDVEIKVHEPEEAVTALGGEAVVREIVLKDKLEKVKQVA